MNQTNFARFLSTTQDARILSQKCRDYYDCKQWTEQEVAELRRRKQAPIVSNRFKKKVEGMKGLVISRRTDPQATGIHPKWEKSGHAVTDGLRFVYNSNDGDQVITDVAECLFLEGYGAAIVDRRGGQIKVTFIPWDRVYFDPRSRRRDFSDAKWMGIALWLDEEDYSTTFPNGPKFDELLDSQEDFDETFDDKPVWFDALEERVRVCQEFYKEKGVWKLRFYAGASEIGTPRNSPYHDEEGEPTNPMILQGCYVDRDGNRYGEMINYLDLQDELNHRRSKYLGFLSHRQILTRRGAIDDPKQFQRELGKVDGVGEYDGEKGDVEIIKNNDMGDAQFNLLKETQNEFDEVGFDPKVPGAQSGRLSADAVDKLQGSGMLDVQSLFECMATFKIRLYRQIWYRMKQFWTEERWVAVTARHEAPRYVGFNAQITFGQALQEIARDETEDPMRRQQAATVLQSMQQQNNQEALNQVVEQRNPIPQLHMNIEIHEAPDTINWQREQLRMLVQLMSTRDDIPVEEVIAMMDLRNKDNLIQTIQMNRQQAMQAQNQAVERRENREDAKAGAEIQKKQAEATSTEIEAMTQMLKNQIISQNPSLVTSVSA